MQFSTYAHDHRDPSKLEQQRFPRWTTLAALLFYCIACPAAADVPPDRPLAQLHHTAWDLRDGAPPDIWALARVTDGYLWLGTGIGLYRFDGMRFERFQVRGQQLLSNNITALTALPSGDLWIGYYFGGMTRLENRRFTHYTPREGVPQGTVSRFAVDSEGAVWAATTGGLARFAENQWRLVGDDWKFGATRADWVHVDRHGTLWVTTGETLVFLRPGARSFEATGERIGRAVLAEAPDGRMWISDELRGTRPLADLQRGARPAGQLDAPLLGAIQSKRMLFDRTGDLWATDALRGGLYRVDAPERVHVAQSLAPEHVNEVFRKEHGLTADVAVPLLEDGEGNIWVGTNLGLNRFRSSDVVIERRIPATSPFGFVLAPAHDEGMYIVNSGSLMKVGPNSFEVLAESLPQINSAYAPREGGVWLGGPDGLRRLEGQRLLHTPPPDRLPRAGIQAITSDRNGVLWVAIRDAGLHQLHAGTWRRVVENRLPASTPSAAFTDSQGRLWFGYPEGTIALREGAHVRVFAGLGIGPVMSITEGRSHIWAGGDLGLARFDGTTMRTLLAGRAPALSGISGVLERDDSLWLNGLLGIVRVELDEIERALGNTDHAFAPDLFDARDGLPGVAQQASPVPTLQASADGRLWFATNHGIVWIDPARLPTTTRAPPVAIRLITASGAARPPEDGIILPKRTSDVRIEYTALSLSAPERTRFSYKLTGVDHDWRDAGDRREVVYTNLGPGTYRFQVRAANGHGIWSKEAATLDFGIAAAFIQTRAFVLLCALAGAAALALLYIARLRQISRRIVAETTARHAERERIARELHDTLLQGMQGLILRLHVLVSRQHSTEALRIGMSSELDRAEALLQEGRDRVHELAADRRVDAPLAQALERLEVHCAEGTSARLDVHVIGQPRILQPHVHEEVLRVAREAISNAFKHAEATHINATLAFSAGGVDLTIVDNGRGIPASVLEQGGRPGHFGIRSMTQRARAIGAELVLSNEATGGARVCLRVPRAAYLRKSRLG